MFNLVIISCRDETFWMLSLGNLEKIEAQYDDCSLEVDPVTFAFLMWILKH